MKLNKIDSNYSYKFLEPISRIRITWDLINLTCKLKNRVTYAKKKITMNKALEQKLIRSMEESHTKQQSPKVVL